MDGSATGDVAELRRRAASALDAVVAEVRATPGFADFLRPASLDQLLPAAAGGTVVVVNVSSFGSHALVVTEGGITDVVDLDRLTAEALRDRVTGLVGATKHMLSASPSGPPRALDDILDDTLRWLWDVLAGPVLDRIAPAGPPPAGDAWPRVWWCTAGLLSFLPVHAAGRHETRASASPETVLDRVVSSYTPTVRALTHARRRPVPQVLAAGDDRSSASDDRSREARTEARPSDRRGPGGGVLVTMPSTPGLADLPGAELEAELVLPLLPRPVVALTGEAATRHRVLNALRTARWAHFCCHAHADLTDPSASHLVLADYQRTPLTVVDVSRLRLADAELAFLSACSTARPGARLADEAIHLASAFQLAGYRHVISTLWPVPDTVALDVARRVYMRQPAADGIAGVLHAVSRRARDSWPQRPSAWASHIHSGE
jgi:hypothetical protein